ncbi:neuronal acetylcholine receptor subunit alpha-9-like [Haliotis cracherodii]|uniref:neuronal acetylcholine receptor subunit alpha-9-like n=1 Tax=Haliotis cracherodii TaxID=6455 RepID=UPI0039E83E8C
MRHGNIAPFLVWLIGTSITEVASISSPNLPIATTRNDTLKDYNTKLRPEEHTVINVTMVLTSLNKLDVSSQTLHTTFLLHLSWIDERLTWTPTNTSSPEYIIFYAKEIWTPPLVVNNAIDDAISILKKEIVPMRVSNRGHVLWIPRLSPTTTCSVDISYFPYDIQHCHINITSWTHANFEVELNPVETAYYTNKVNLDFYPDDKEWFLQHYGVSKQDIIGGHGFDYTNLQYSFVFKRHHPFYKVMLIVPFAVLSLCLCFTYVIPLKSGEKISFAITTMVAFQLYQVMLSELLPPIAEFTETYTFGEYLMCVWIQAAIVTIGTAVQLRAFYWEEFEEDPKNPKRSRVNVLKILDCVGFILSFVYWFIITTYFLTTLTKGTDKELSANVDL